MLCAVLTDEWLCNLCAKLYKPPPSLMLVCNCATTPGRASEGVVSELTDITSVPGAAMDKNASNCQELTHCLMQVLSNWIKFSAKRYACRLSCSIGLLKIHTSVMTHPQSNDTVK